MPERQDDALRLQKAVERARRPGGGRRICVTSGKGGVGKSNFALNAAIALAALKKRVLLIDADTNLANLDILLGLNPAADLSDVIAGERTLREIIISGPGGVDILPGSSGVVEMLDLDNLVQLRMIEAFIELESAYEFIIIDTGAGLNPSIVSYVTRSDEMVLITNPEPTSIADAYAMIKIMSHHNPALPIRLVVNLVKSAEQAAEVFERINLVVQNFLNLPILSLGYLPHDPNIPRAVAMQKPFLLAFPKSPASVVMGMMVRKLLQTV